MNRDLLGTKHLCANKAAELNKDTFLEEPEAEQVIHGQSVKGLQL